MTIITGLYLTNYWKPSFDFDFDFDFGLTYFVIAVGYVALAAVVERSVICCSTPFGNQEMMRRNASDFGSLHTPKCANSYH